MMKVPIPIRHLHSGACRPIVADTTMCTVELGARSPTAPLDDAVTVVFCDLLVDGPDRCRGAEASSGTGTRSCGR